MHLITRHLQHRHFRKHVYVLAIALNQAVYSLFALRAFDADFPSGKNKAGGKPLEVPLKRPANSLIKVIDVKDQPSIGSSIGTEIADMGITANLIHDAGVRQQ